MYGFLGETRICGQECLLRANIKFKGHSHRAVDTLTRLAALLFSRNIYVPRMRAAHTETAEILSSERTLRKENAIGTCAQEREFVRNEILANSARPIGFSRPSTSSYSAAWRREIIQGDSRRCGVTSISEFFGLYFARFRKPV